MAQPQPSTKRIKIDKANTTMITIVAVATFVVIFSLVSAKVLFSQLAYQNRVIDAKKTAVSQLKTDKGTVANLATAYAAFEGTPQNILGGNPNGNNQNDGDNAKIILDALPSQYDFPGLASSLSTFLTNQGFNVDSISGTDQQLTQQAVQSSGTPTPQQIPFQLSFDGSYSAIQKAIGLLQRSIRPIVIQQVNFTGTDQDLTASVTAYTYYQPAKNFSITTEVVKWNKKI